MSVVLIVEDEIIELDFLKTLVIDELKPEDTLLTCDNGVKAVQLAKRYRPNIIIMDLMIPEMDGLTAIKEIRKFLPNAYITILSAYSDFSYAQKAISLRVFEYILKPVKPAVLKDLICSMLQLDDYVTTPGDETLTRESIDIKGERQYFIEESIKYIEAHFTEKLTLEMVASMVFVNPKYFSHVFKKQMGITFTEYIVNLKIQHACKLLEMTNYRAYRISLECGFSDPSYFNRVFCAQMKMTPQTYRKYANASKKDSSCDASN